MRKQPFEHDDPELLEAAIAALAAVALRPAEAPPERVRTAEPAPVYAAWQREAAEHTAVQSAAGAMQGDDPPFVWPDPAPVSLPLRAEDLSREIERDARRFQAN